MRLGAIRTMVAVLSLAGAFTALSAGSAGASDKKPIILGLVTDETGNESAQYVDAAAGAMARIDAQNAAGGVDGHKLEVIEEDDTGTPGGASTAEHLLVSKGAFGIIADGSTFFGGTPYLSSAGIPVVGQSGDGTEWTLPASTNMFNIGYLAVTNAFDGYYWGYSNTLEEYKDLGITKLAALVYPVPSAEAATTSIFSQAKAVGISDCLDALVPADQNLQPFALEMKNLGCNGVTVESGISSCIGLATAFKQADVTAKLVCTSDYDQDLLDQPTALAATQGTYTSPSAITINFSAKPEPAAVSAYLNSLHKYTDFKGALPNTNIDFAYMSADAFIKGLELAGPNPTRKEFITKLRTVGNYTVEGLVTTPINFTHFGTLGMLAKTSCTPILEVKGKGFVDIKDTCGKLIKGSKAS